ncbi:hypothetical protein C8J57DRAFT_1236532 [Mycena rebaudengoi]|nr:hypothetical protein C8J57DRAFT_1236532 [Mycena rebaudengoi]
MSNWNHIVLLLSWSYALASRWVTTSIILLVLILRRTPEDVVKLLLCHIMMGMVEDTLQLAFYWIYDKLPGKRGSLDAVTPEKGKRYNFKCAGIIQCTAMKTLLLQEFISRQPVVFRGSQTTMNSRISDDQDSQESGKEGDEMNSEDERLLDPEADEEE